MARRKLPQGLRNFQSDLKHARLQLPLLRSLLSLQENGLHDHVERHQDYIAKIEQAELALKHALDAAKIHAQRVWESVLANWTIQQIQEAVGFGYDH